jgi:hypothetical protein
VGFLVFFAYPLVWQQSGPVSVSLFKEVVALEDSQALRQLLVEWEYWVAHVVSGWNTLIQDVLLPLNTRNRKKTGGGTPSAFSPALATAISNSNSNSNGYNGAGSLATSLVLPVDASLAGPLGRGHRRQPSGDVFGGTDELPCAPSLAIVPPRSCCFCR